ncbi:hypothetical protein AYK21_04845 [Thermoplasmatales archaeon SG8-52-2]|nr:MAG: hypothetical protein AYK21_04845 [Thermoplasmatales archaeon SG8-52-2]
MKKTIVLLLIILVLFIFFSLTAQAGLKIWPGKIRVEMNKWFDEEKIITQPIQISNPYSYGVNVSSRVENPNIKSITDSFSPIPDTFFIRTSPEELYIPPKSSENIEIIINIPENQHEFYYGEKWETGIVISSDIPLGPNGGSMNFELEIAVKLFIITPKSETEGFQYYYIFIFIFLIILVITISSYIRKKKENLKSVYYFKNKK